MSDKFDPPRDPISEPLLTIMERLQVLNGSISLLDNQMGNFQKLFRQSHKNTNQDISQIRAGFALMIRDLSVSVKQRYHKYVVAGVFTKQGEEYLDATQEMISHWAAWTVAQCYEAFETFLRDINAFYHYVQRPSLPFGRLKSLPTPENDITAWKEFFRRNWKNKEMLSQLRFISPALRKWEHKNIIDLDLTEWFLLLKLARDAVTHSQMIIKGNKLKASKDSVKRLLPVTFHGKWDNANFILEITKEDAKSCIKLTGEYAFLIFKCVCEAGNFDWKVLKQLN